MRICSLTVLETDDQKKKVQYTLRTAQCVDQTRTYPITEDQVTDSEAVARTSKLRSAVFTLFLLIWIIIGASTMLIAKLFRLRNLERKFPELFHGTVAKMCNMNCVVHGDRHESPGTFYVANHASYLDVFVLGGVIEGSFVAKSEVSGWPVFGKLAQLQNTVFLERKAQRAAEQVALLQSHLAAGRRLIVFPEGTSTSGDYVAPFRSSLYRAAAGQMIQPVSVVYALYDGQPMTRATRDLFAWYLPDPKVAVPNRAFLPHFVAALGLRPSTVHIVFHEPFLMAEDADRKSIAQRSEAAVRAGLELHLNVSAANGHA